jgi:gas vesicle protein
MVKFIIWNVLSLILKSLKEKEKPMSTIQVREENDGVIEFIIGMIVGIAAGGVLAILFAPKSGKETQKSIQGFVTNLPNQVRDDFQEAGEKSRELIGKAKINFENQVDKVNNAIRAGKQAEAKKREELASGGYDYN